MKRISTLFGVALMCAAVGCGPEVKQQSIDRMGAAPEAEQDKIRQALDKAGIKKKIAAINDAGDEWMVILELEGLGPQGEAPPGRPMPEKALVHKTTFNVKKIDTVGAGRGQGGGGGSQRELDPMKDKDKK